MAEEAILNQGSEVNKGESARLSSFVGAIAISDMVKTTLGPKGMDKILQHVGDPRGQVTVTNDGATILRSIPVENPAAKVLVDIAKTQDETIGDGTTSVAVLCGELLREAEHLINERVHPMTIIKGWRKSVEIAKAALSDLSVDNKEDEEAFRADLLAIARTTLSSKLLNVEKDYFAQLAVDAVLRIQDSGNLDYIQVIKKPGGSLADSYLEEGFVMDKRVGVGQPRRVENARILIANTPMDTDKIKIYGSKVEVDSMTKVAEIEEAEKDKMREKCHKIISHGVNCFVNRQLIYNFPEEIFTQNGVMTIEHADFDGVERLAAVTGGEIVSTFDHPEMVQLGECDLIDEIIIGEDRLIRFSGCKSGRACSVILRGASSHLLDEAERSFHDAIAVLSQTVKETRSIPGGGCAEMSMANSIDQEVPKTAGKQALAMEAFSRALRQLPMTIADNAGLDSAELISSLRAEHANGNNLMGLDVNQGAVGDMMVLGVRESFLSKLHVLVNASEAAEMILRVDEVFKSAPRQRPQGR
jgi:T-complex protein 1 subunit beta